jgi:hypothetical protein
LLLLFNSMMQVTRRKSINDEGASFEKRVYNLDISVRTVTMLTRKKSIDDGGYESFKKRVYDLDISGRTVDVDESNRSVDLDYSTAAEKSPPTVLTITKNIKSEKKNPTPTTTHWWHTIYLVSFISLACCILQIMLPPPFGMLMTSAEVAKIGIAPEGCQDGMSRCICPRTTVCATNLVSLILLTIARCSAFFDYPLYMMMFFSKCHNLNNIPLSDYTSRIYRLWRYESHSFNLWSCDWY